MLTCAAGLPGPRTKHPDPQTWGRTPSRGLGRLGAPSQLFSSSETRAVGAAHTFPCSRNLRGVWNVIMFTLITE